MAPLDFFLPAFSAALVTGYFVRKWRQRSQKEVLTLATLLSLLDGLDSASGNGLPHIADSETTEWRVLIVGLDTHGLARDELRDESTAGLDKTWANSQGTFRFACPSSQSTLLANLQAMRAVWQSKTGT